jgi:hypothetical protein
MFCFPHLLFYFNKYISQRFEAHLENIHEGEDGEKLCASTPYDFFGQHFEHPDSCANWVSFVVAMSRLFRLLTATARS